MAAPPALLFLFGATGDLVAKKVLPALQQWDNGRPPFVRIWCLGRRPFDTTAYIAHVEQKGGFRIAGPLQTAIRYHQLDFADSAAYRDLAHKVTATGDPAAPRLFFLAVRPEAFVPITSGLHACGLF